MGKGHWHALSRAVVNGPETQRVLKAGQRGLDSGASTASLSLTAQEERLGSKRFVVIAVLVALSTPQHATAHEVEHRVHHRPRARPVARPPVASSDRVRHRANEAAEVCARDLRRTEHHLGRRPELEVEGLGRLAHAGRLCGVGDVLNPRGDRLSLSAARGAISEPARYKLLK